MKNTIETTKAEQQYATAHASHYGKHNLLLALQLYKQILASYPNTPEADYTRSQIQNIVHAVVPKQELLQAQMELVFTHLEHSIELPVMQA